jgi:hypothetical protein
MMPDRIDILEILSLLDSVDAPNSGTLSGLSDCRSCRSYLRPTSRHTHGCMYSRYTTVDDSCPSSAHPLLLVVSPLPSDQLPISSAIAPLYTQMS